MPLLMRDTPYIPMLFVKEGYLIDQSTYGISDVSMFEFGVLHSSLHMLWLNFVGGKHGQSYRYSGTVVYNTFPWPSLTHPRDARKVEAASERMLLEREKIKCNSLTELYRNLLAAPDVLNAHRDLDEVVSNCYGIPRQSSDFDRFSHLLAMYFQATDRFDARPDPVSSEVEARQRALELRKRMFEILETTQRNLLGQATGGRRF